MRKVFLIACAVVTLMSACSHKTEIWTAQKPTTVYASDSEDDLHNKAVFVLDVGDTCTWLSDVVMKEAQHTELQCRKGRGWVVDKQNSEIHSGH